MKKYIIYFAILFSLIPLVVSAEESRDVVIVLDTSLSMEGYDNFGGRDFDDDVFEEVKANIQDYLNLILRPADSFTLMTFGQSVEEGPKVMIKDTDIQTLSQQTADIIANDAHTYTLLMVQSLKNKLLEYQAENPQNQRLAIIFTDAKDDPPTGQARSQLEALFADQGLLEKGVTGHVYYYSLNNDFSENLTKKLLEYFPDASIQPFSIRGNGFEDAKKSLLRDLKPSLKLEFALSKSGQLDPGETYVGYLRIIPNYEAKNLNISFEQTSTVEPLVANFADFGRDINNLSLDRDNIDIPFEVEVPWSAEGEQFSLDLAVQLETDKDHTIQDQNGNDIKNQPLMVNLSVREATFVELIQHNMFYTISAIILGLIILLILYQLLRYVLFVPRLKLNYWEQVVEDSEIVDKNVIDLASLAKGTYLFSGNEKSENLLYLPALKYYENFGIIKKGTKRRPIALIRNTSEKMRFSNLKKFRSRRLKNGTAFKIGTYTFEVNTNIK